MPLVLPQPTFALQFSRITSHTDLPCISHANCPPVQVRMTSSSHWNKRRWRENFEDGEFGLNGAYAA